MRNAALALLGLLGLCPPVDAQSIGGNASLSVTGSSSRVSIPASVTRYPFVMLNPAVGVTQEMFYALGDSSVAATTSSPALPASGVCLAVGPNTNVAAITSTSTATLRVTQMSQCPLR